MKAVQGEAHWQLLLVLALPAPLAVALFATECIGFTGAHMNTSPLKPHSHTSKTRIGVRWIVYRLTYVILLCVSLPRR